MAYIGKLSLNIMISITELANQHTHTQPYCYLINYLIFVFLKISKAEFIKHECYVETKWWGKEVSDMILEILKHALTKEY